MSLHNHGEHLPPVYTIHVGELYASRKSLIIKTLLGSCIAVCLFDPIAHVGGMNHFLLPRSGEGEAASARYGMHAMELLINECMKIGADRRRMEAKVFGGAHVLKAVGFGMNIPQKNIQFTLDYLKEENIPIIRHDVGGTSAREVNMFTDTGRILLRRLGKESEERKEVLKEIVKEERNIVKCKPIDNNGNVTLF